MNAINEVHRSALLSVVSAITNDAELRTTAGDIVDFIAGMPPLNCQEVMFICAALKASTCARNVSVDDGANYFLIPTRLNAEQASKIVRQLREALDDGLYEEETGIGECQSKLDDLQEHLSVVHIKQARIEEGESIAENVDSFNKQHNYKDGMQQISAAPLMNC